MKCLYLVLIRRLRISFLKTNLISSSNYFSGSTNPRIMISGKTLISLCHLVPDGASVAKMGPRKNNYGLTIDTLSNNDKSIFYKFNSNEMYPDHVLVYRDLEGMYNRGFTKFGIKVA